MGVVPIKHLSISCSSFTTTYIKREFSLTIGPPLWDYSAKGKSNYVYSCCMLQQQVLLRSLSRINTIFSKRRIIITWSSCFNFSDMLSKISRFCYTISDQILLKSCYYSFVWKRCLGEWGRGQISNDDIFDWKYY